MTEPYDDGNVFARILREEELQPSGSTRTTRRL